MPRSPSSLSPSGFPTKILHALIICTLHTLPIIHAIIELP
jgi:hypothetical protein